MLIHELGHYICARIFNVGINEFAIGMGPKIISHTSKKTGIAYSLRLLPVGGFVSMVGEDEECEDERAFIKKPVWQRMIITVAGAFMNILLGIIIMCIITACSKGLGSTEIAKFIPDESTGVSVSEQSGLMVGDKILSVDGTKTHTSYDLLYTVMRKGVGPVDVEIIRNGEKTVVKNVEFPTEINEGILFGSADFYVRAEEKTFFTVVKHSFYQSFATIRLIWDSLFDLISGKYGVEQMSGPVGVTGVISDAAKTSTYSLAYITVVITMNLGICNLLPLPALDGGRLVFQIVELIRGKAINPKYEGMIHFAGLMILMAFMLFITYKDILKLIGT